MTESGMERNMIQTARALGIRFDLVFDELELIRPQVQQVLNNKMARHPTRADLRTLKQPLVDLVRGSEGLVDGAGIAVGPGTLRDNDLWLEWWRISNGQEERFAPHSFDHRSIGFYDYTDLSWFRLPNETNEPSAVGPYLDSGGTDLRVVTVSVPCALDEGKRAILAADLSLAALEVLLVRKMGSERAVALVTETGKVIASNSPRHAGVALLGDDALGRAELREMIPTGDHRRFAWQLVSV